MNLRAAIAKVALTIAVFAPAAAHAAGAFPFDGIPGLKPGQHLEAVVLIEDLRALRQSMEGQRTHLLKTEIGKAYFAPENQKALLGFDMYAETDNLVAIAAPKGSAVPALVAAVSGEDGFHFQLAIKTEPGVAERLLAAKGAVHGTGSPAAFTVVVGEKIFPAKADGAWLRVGLTDADIALEGAPPLQALPPTFAKLAADSHVVVAVLGGGKVASGLAELAAGTPIAQQLISTTRAFGMTVRYDADNSQVARIVLDADGIRDFAPMFARPAGQPSAASRWDAQALRAFQLALPPSLMPTLAMVAQSALGETPDPAVSKLVETLAQANGTMSVASFGAPYDWALSLGFNDDASAKAFVDAFHGMVASYFAKYKVDAALATKSTAPNGEVVSLRPDVVLSATTVTSYGSTVHLTRQPARVARTQKLEAAKDGKRLVDGPLTPAVRELLARNAMLQGYMVSGADGSSFELFYWPAKALEIGLAHFKDMIPQSDDMTVAATAVGTSGVSRLPLTLAVGAYGFGSIYDMAFTLDVEGSALVLQLASSHL